MPVDSDRTVRIERLRAVQRLLDSAFRVPGTRVRFGWDPILGLFPWVGDVATALLACGLVLQAHQMRLPRVVQLRMVLNVAIDVVVGLVPLLGDVADVFWKANTRNMALLERHAGELRPATAGDYFFVAGVLLAILAVAALPVLVLYWLFHAVLQRPLI